MRRVMIFGTFDGVHDGHRSLFEQASALGDELLVVLARDEHVLELKGHVPTKLIAERLDCVACESEVTRVIEGDEELGSYAVIIEHEPTLVVIGYDQDELLQDLELWLEENKIEIPMHRAAAHMPEVFKTSLLMDRELDEVYD